MRRRELIAGLAAAVALLVPQRAPAQSSPKVVGLLGIGSAEASASSLAAFHRGLAETGFRSGYNVTIEMRWAPANDHDRLKAHAVELIGRGAGVLVATGSAPVARAAQAASSTIPIVFANGSDPVAVGLVASMNRPGANMTGVSFHTSTLGPKRLELLRELAPSARSMAFLVNPTNPVTAGDVANLEAAARTIGQKLSVVRASSETELEAAFSTIDANGIDGVIVNVDAFFTSRRQQITALALRYQKPASYNNSLFVRSGGLISYGDDRADSYRQLGLYVGRVLKGEKPADLPVMQPTKFELAVNLKTARALGLTVPALFLTRADEVIE